jgi:tellurite resistance protein TerC
MNQVASQAWAVFFVVVLAVLIVDLWSSRGGRALSFRAAALWSALWISISVAFGLWTTVQYGRELGLQYFAGYLVEMALSVDNVFVFVLVFAQLRIPARYQRRILFLGILSALLMRGLMIAGGVSLLGRFQWVTYLFAGVLLISAVRLLFGTERERAMVRQSCDACRTWIARVVPVSPSVAGGRFFQRHRGRLAASPLLVALIVIETTDVVFAIDSIPTVLAITRDPFVAYSSNLFAMLGLRSLYFLVAAAVDRFQYVRPGLAAILVFVAAKMLLEPLIHITVTVSLLVIIGVLAVTFGLSLWAGDRRRNRRSPAPDSAR